MSALQTLESLRSEVAILQAERDAARARVETLEKELARYQRADVGDRVEAIDAAMFADQTTGSLREGVCDLLTICRQQAAGIERLTNDCAWAAKKLRDMGAELERLTARLRGHDGLREHIESLPGSDACGNAMVGIPVLLVRDAVLAAFESEERDTDKVELLKEVEQFNLGQTGSPVGVSPGPTNAVGGGHVEDNQAPRNVAESQLNPGGAPALSPCLPQSSPKPDDFRAGLPAEALRKVCEKWAMERHPGEICEFSEHHGQWRWTEAGKWTKWYRLPGSGLRDGYRPHNASWSEVETLAAQHLGAKDAREGRAKRGCNEVQETIYGAVRPGLSEVTEYDSAYDAAKGG